MDKDIRELKLKLVNDLNSAGMPIEVKRLVLAEILREVERLSEQVIAEQIKEQSKEEEEDAESVH